MTAYEATLAPGAQSAGTPNLYEVQGYWEGSHKDVSQDVSRITILELETVGFAILLETRPDAGERDVWIYTDNVVAMWTVAV